MGSPGDEVRRRETAQRPRLAFPTTPERLAWILLLTSPRKPSLLPRLRPELSPGPTVTFPQIREGHTAGLRAVLGRVTVGSDLGSPGHLADPGPTESPLYVSDPHLIWEQQKHPLHTHGHCKGSGR